MRIISAILNFSQCQWCHIIALKKVPNEHSYRFCLIFPMSEVITIWIPPRLIYRVVKYRGFKTWDMLVIATMTMKAAKERFVVPWHTNQKGYCDGNKNKYRSSKTWNNWGSLQPFEHYFRVFILKLYIIHWQPKIFSTQQTKIFYQLTDPLNIPITSSFKLQSISFRISGVAFLKRKNTILFVRF